MIIMGYRNNIFLGDLIIIPVKQYVITLKLIYKVHEQINKK